MPPRLPFGELAVGVKAGELCTRSGAAGRTVVFDAGTQDEIAAVGRCRWREKLDMVDLGIVGSGDVVFNESLADGDRKRCKLL